MNCLLNPRKSSQGSSTGATRLGVAFLVAWNDGGVWKSANGGRTWQDINTFGFLATQFESVAAHPNDPNFTIGGTQDNGTIFLQPSGRFTRADFGDGGYAAIDQSATDTENVTMYHTYFNATGSLIGFGRVLKTSCATEGEWSFMGIYGGDVDPTVHCDGTTDTFNGISINDNVNFYAPIALGPGTPNVVYFGTDRLYRSTDRGTNASQTPNWTAAGSGIPDVSVNGLVIDPRFPNHLYAGTDFGVYASTDGGSTWHRFGIGFPRVEVYDITLQGKFRILRAATHGLGIFQARLSEVF
jgi:hypothetical protein